MTVSLATRLKELRIRRGQSLQEIADAVGISKAHLWNLERGESRNPSADILTKLAEVFKVGVADLIGENPNAEGEKPELVALYRDLKTLSERDRKMIQALVEQFKTSKGD